MKRIFPVFLTTWCILFLFHPTGIGASTVPPGSGRSTSTVGSTFKDLPLGAAPVIASVLARDLPRNYRPVKQGDSYASINPAHGMATTFTLTGPRVTIGSTSWGMRLTGVGFPGAMRPVADASLRQQGNGVEYARGGLTEWYVNTPLGLEQGFTLHERPGKAGEGELVVELSLTGKIAPTLEGDALLIADAAGTPLVRYTGLYVYDANFSPLPARLSLEGTILSIHVDEQEATYPVTIDPWLQRAKLTASDGAESDILGFSVAISNNTIVVGAPDADGGKGAAYVFEKPSDGGWATMTETARLTASDRDEGPPFSTRFGDSVAIDTDTIVVGAPGWDLQSPEPRQAVGAVYVFVRPADGWATMTETARLTASDSLPEDCLGVSVAIETDAIVAGALPTCISPRDLRNGAAYVFVRPSGGWTSGTETAKLTPSDGTTMDWFGNSVGINGATIVVGAPGHNNSAGAVYVFTRALSGWASATESAKLSAGDGETEDGLGVSVSIDSDTIVAGAVGDDAWKGAVYVFTKPVSGWTSGTETAKLVAGNGAADDRLGISVAINNNTIAAGAIRTNFSDRRLPGRVYVFEKPESSWMNGAETVSFAAGDTAGGDFFGRSVAISGETVVAGAMAVDSGKGAAYVYTWRKFPWAMINPVLTGAGRNR
ncbi:MAG: hypothetical protein Kow0089_12970 [Desulfobulbaceae bacterium]